MVTYFDNTMAGAPAMSGSVGQMLAVLDACLVTGFGVQAASSVTIATGVATVTLPTPHSLRLGASVRISGASPGGLNGDWPVLSVTSTTLTFATAATGTVTGTVSVSHAPLGWAKEFSGTNLAAYRSADVTGTRMRLYVDDTASTCARVIGYEVLTDMATGFNPFPTSLQQSGGLYWIKSSVADASARNWVVIGDSRAFYLYVSPHLATQDHGWGHIFGDYNSLRPGDPYACLLTGHPSNDAGNSSRMDIAKALNYAMGDGFLARPYSGLGGSVGCFAKSAFAINHDTRSGTSSYSDLSLVYPNGPDNGLITAQKQIFSNNALRGNCPGLLHTPQPCQSAFNTGDIIAGVGPYSGRRLICLRSGTQMFAAKNTDNSGAGVVFIDLTGPWR